MPPADAVTTGKAPGVPVLDYLKFKKWNLIGRPKGTASKFTYANDIKGWLDHYCISCHGLDLEYDFSSQKRAQSFAGRMIIRMLDRDSPMPPTETNEAEKAETIPTTDFSKIETWVKDGAP